MHRNTDASHRAYLHTVESNVRTLITYVPSPDSGALPNQLNLIVIPDESFRARPVWNQATLSLLCNYASFL